MGNYLIENTDEKIVGISRSPEYHPIFLPYLYKKSRPSRFQFLQLDINKDLGKIFSILDQEQPRAIYNFAAQGEVQHSWEHPDHWFKTNGLGMVNLVNGLRQRDYLKKYIHISTPEVYGAISGNMKEDPYYYNPSSPYAASKAAGDLFIWTTAKVWNFPAVMIRSTNVYGIHQQLYRIIPRTIIYLKMGKKIELQGGGKAIKSFIHIRDVVDGIYKASQSKTPELYHLSPDGDGNVIADVVKLVCEKMGYRLQDSTISTGDRIGQDARYVLNSEKARNELSWKPGVQFEKGIDEMITWIEENWEEIKKQPLHYVHKD